MILRQIILDTETTGLNVRDGNRILEVGAVELVNRKLTGNNFHYYINPERESEEGALAVHGLTTEFLSDKPVFAQIAKEFLDYIKDAELLIHNASFDVGFLNAELARLGLGSIGDHVSGVVDTLAMAKDLHPGKRNSLDALCSRYQISNAHRKLHGALLDAELLADVYLAMTRGQNSFVDLDEGNEEKHQVVESDFSDLPLADVLVQAANAAEMLEHTNLLDGLDKQMKSSCIWRKQYLA